MLNLCTAIDPASEHQVVGIPRRLVTVPVLTSHLGTERTIEHTVDEKFQKRRASRSAETFERRKELIVEFSSNVTYKSVVERA